MSSDKQANFLDDFRLEEFDRVSKRAMTEFDRHLFDPEHKMPEDLHEDLLRAALYTEMALEELPADPTLAETVVRVRNDVGTAVVRGFLLLRRSNPRWLREVELASSLFSSAGYTAKAFAILRQYRKSIDALGSMVDPSVSSEEKLRWGARRVLALLEQRDFKTLKDQAEGLRALGEGSSMSRDHVRFSRVLASFADQLDRIAREPPEPTDRSSSLAKTKILGRLALGANDEELVGVTRRLDASLQSFLQRSLSFLAARGRFQLGAQYRPQVIGRGSAHPIFELWPPQAAAAESGLLSRGSWVISMPTSAGKTFLAELKIVSALIEDPNSLTVYVAPYSALANQVADRLGTRLRPAGLADPLIWTGAYEIDPDVPNLGRLLITTPEKLDSILRSGLEDDARSQDLVERLSLVILDECHLIGTPERGLTYELLISRLRRVFPHVEMCAMSAVLGNPGALAKWLTNDETRVSTSSWRPTDTRFFVYLRNGNVVEPDGTKIGEFDGWSTAKNAGARMAHHLANRFEWPVFVLETRRDYAEDVAREILKRVRDDPWPTGSNAQRERERAAKIAQDELGVQTDLPSMLSLGVAFHHAGLPTRVRRTIEQLVARRYLRVICSTTTLAEGVDLPFRSVVCPHLHFEGVPMTRSVFQNISGRAGRAFVSTEGLVVFLEPGKERDTSYLFNELLLKANEPINVISQFPTITRTPIKPYEWKTQWRFQSQMLGLLGQDFESEEQATRLVSASFASASTVPARTLSALKRKANSFLNRITETAPPLATAASPFALTSFGEAASLSGLGADSALILRRELLQMAQEDRAWLDENAWGANVAPVDLISDITRLSFSPLEAFAGAIDMPAKYREFENAVSGWLAGSKIVFETVTNRDRELLLSWIRGEDARDIAAGESAEGAKKGPLRKKTVSGRVLDLNDYFSRMSSLLGWMYSGAIRIAEYLNENEELQVPGAIRLGINFVRYGVDSRGASLFTAKIGIPRVAAVRLVDALSYDAAALDESLLEALFSASEEEIRTIVQDPNLSERTLEVISLSADVEEPQ